MLFRREPSLYKRALDALRAQQDELILRRAEIRDLQRLCLANQQTMRDLAIGWRVSMEQPEIDLRDELDALIENLSNTVAQMEEHVL